MEEKEIINKILLVKIKKQQQLSNNDMMKYVYNIIDNLYAIISEKGGNARLFDGNVEYWPIAIISEEIKSNIELGFLEDTNISDEELKTLTKELREEIKKKKQQ